MTRGCGHRRRLAGLVAGLAGLGPALWGHGAGVLPLAVRWPLFGAVAPRVPGTSTCPPPPPLLHAEPGGPGPFDLVADRVTGRVFVATTDGVRVLDGTTGRLVATTRVGTSPGVGPGTLADDPQTGRVFVADAAFDDAVNHAPGQVAMLDGRSGAVLRTTVVGQYPTTVAVDGPARRVFVVNYRGDSVSVLDADSGAVVHTTPIAQPLRVVVDTGTHHAFVTSYTGTVTVLDARNGTFVAVTPVGSDPRGLAVDEPDARVFVTAAIGLSRRLVVLDAHSGALVQRLATGATPDAVAVNGRTGRVFVAGAGTIRVLDARRLTLLGDVPLDRVPVPIQMGAPEGDRVFALTLGATAVAGVASGRGNVGVLDAVSGRLLALLPVGEAPRAVALVTQSQNLFVANSGDNTVDILRLLPSPNGHPCAGSHAAMPSTPAATTSPRVSGRRLA